MQGGNPAVEAAMMLKGFRAQQREEILTFDTGKFQLQEAVLEMLAGTEPSVLSTGLAGVHEAFDASWDRSKSFKKHTKRLNGQLCKSTHGARLRRECERFVCDFIAPQVQAHMPLCDSLFFESMPSLRIQPPSDERLGYPHSDGMYFHQRGQLNFWVPMTRVYSSNTLWVESKPGLQDYHPLELDYGQCARFYGNQCMHFTLPNDTPHTRVSLDLRVVPGPCFDTDPPESRGRNGRPLFTVGGYYALATYCHDLGTWAVAEGTQSAENSTKKSSSQASLRIS